MDTLDQLRELKAKALAKVTRLRAQIATHEQELDELDTTIRVLERLADPGTAATAAAPNENGVLILGHVGVGEDEALAPKEIVDRLVAAGHDLNADLVRTQLWRMARRGTLESENGKYWKPLPEGDPFQEYANSVEQEQKRAFDEWTSSEQANRATSGFDDLPDDVPF